VRQVSKKGDSDPTNRFLRAEGYWDYDAVRVG
jgi:hypothetical protein